jgi:hypothetical protein
VGNKPSCSKVDETPLVEEETHLEVEVAALQEEEATPWWWEAPPK